MNQEDFEWWCELTDNKRFKIIKEARDRDRK